MSCMWLSKPPELYPLHKRIKIALSDITFEDDDGTVFIHKRGFPTDGASISYLLQLIWNPFNVAIIRSVLQHDIQYTEHDFNPFFIQTRKQVDRRFLRSLRCEQWDYSRLWYRGVRMFGGFIWLRMCKNQDALAWYTATQQGEEALDEWIEKCKENPRKLESVRYYDQIQNDLLRSFTHTYNDLRGLKLWYCSDDNDYDLD
ncbi:DUF1353 domain-containing protein [Verrucomicrobiota bacterium]